MPKGGSIADNAREDLFDLVTIPQFVIAPAAIVGRLV